jgi:hypothetical protein
VLGFQSCSSWPTEFLIALRPDQLAGEQAIDGARPERPGMYPIGRPDTRGKTTRTACEAPGGSPRLDAWIAKKAGE